MDLLSASCLLPEFNCDVQNQRVYHGTYWMRIFCNDLRPVPHNELKELYSICFIKYNHYVSEPNDYFYPKNLPLNGARIGKDFRILHKLLLTEYYFTNFTFVGPDSGAVTSEHGQFSE